MQNRELAFVLLLVQAGNALLPTFVQWAFLGSMGGLGLMALGSLGGTLGLLLLAAGVLRERRWARRGTTVVEWLMLLGTIPRLLQSMQAQAGPEAAWMLTNIGLPAAIILTLRSTPPVSWALRALLAASGLVHLALVGEHGGLFLADAALLVGLALVGPRARWWRRVAVVVLLANLIGYMGALGSGQEGLESVGLVTKLIELVALGLLLLPRPAEHGWGRRVRWAAATLGLLSVTFLLGGVAWGAAGRAEARRHGHADEADLLAQLRGPTAEERLAAADLAEATRVGIQRYAEPEVAVGDGYRATTPTNGRTVHYMHAAREKDGEVLSPERPEGLVYANTADGPLLLGAVFTMPRVGLAGPAPGGSLTHWHTHDNVCISIPVIALAGLASPLGACPPGTVNLTTPAMMHVWVVDVPGGPFADELDAAFVARL